MSSRGALRLAIDATPLIGPRTGIGRFVARLVDDLAKRDDVETRAYAVTWRGRDQLRAALPPAISTAQRPMAARPLHLAWRSPLPPPVEWWIGRADVVHGTNYVVPPTRRAATVVSVHDLTSVHYPELCTPHVRSFPRQIARAIARGAFIHADSEFVRGEVLSHFDVPPSRVVTVPLGFDPVIGGDPEVGQTLAGASRYVLSVGTVEPRKGYPTLVRAFDRLAARDAQLRLVIAGGRGWGHDEFAQSVHAARHHDRIVHLDYLPQSDLVHVIAGARVLAYPSVYEGFGFPPLEAMSAGVPVVATEAGSIPEVVGDAAALVAVGDDQALATSLDRAINDERWRAELVARGRVRTGHFSWHAMTDGLCRLYRQAADARGSAPEVAP